MNTQLQHSEQLRISSYKILEDRLRELERKLALEKKETLACNSHIEELKGTIKDLKEYLTANVSSNPAISYDSFGPNTVMGYTHEDKFMASGYIAGIAKVSHTSEKALVIKLLTPLIWKSLTADKQKELIKYNKLVCVALDKTDVNYTPKEVDLHKDILDSLPEFPKKLYIDSKLYDNKLTVLTADDAHQKHVNSLYPALLNAVKV